MLKNNCNFCLSDDSDKKNILMDHGTVYAVYDIFPVTDKHILIVPKRHVESYFDLIEAERRDAERLLFALKEKVVVEDPSVTGFNIGINCGIAAGQTIMHAHIHLIPRRNGDCEDPAGGVRCVIAEKMKY